MLGTFARCSLHTPLRTPLRAPLSAPSALHRACLPFLRPPAARLCTGTGGRTKTIKQMRQGSSWIVDYSDEVHGELGEVARQVEAELQLPVFFNTRAAPCRKRGELSCSGGTVGPGCLAPAFGTPWPASGP